MTDGIWHCEISWGWAAGIVGLLVCLVGSSLFPLGHTPSPFILGTHSLKPPLAYISAERQYTSLNFISLPIHHDSLVSFTRNMSKAVTISRMFLINILLITGTCYLNNNLHVIIVTTLNLYRPDFF